MTTPRFLLCSAVSACFVIALVQSPPGRAESGKVSPVRMWEQLLADAGKLHLPTQFLKEIPSDFVHFEFDDLRTYAAEYHPGEHRLVLNRGLSFNSAGGTLRPLTKMTHKELEVLYHELFHAYMDFLAGGRDRADHGASSDSLLSFAREQQECRYGEVAITPVVQRKDETEARYLTESESWEALNETWAVFVGWAIWNQLEVQQKGRGSMLERARAVDQWLLRFEQAVQKGELRGYYVPEDPDERRVTHKRFLARQSQLSGDEARAIMGQVLGFSEKVIEKVRARPALAAYFKPRASCARSPG